MPKARVGSTFYHRAPYSRNPSPATGRPTVKYFAPLWRRQWQRIKGANSFTPLYPLSLYSLALINAFSWRCSPWETFTLAVVSYIHIIHEHAFSCNFEILRFVLVEKNFLFWVEIKISNDQNLEWLKSQSWKLNSKMRKQKFGTQICRTCFCLKFLFRKYVRSIMFENISVPFEVILWILE